MWCKPPHATCHEVGRVHKYAVTLLEASCYGFCLSFCAFSSIVVNLTFDQVTVVGRVGALRPGRGRVSTAEPRCGLGLEVGGNKWEGHGWKGGGFGGVSWRKVEWCHRWDIQMSLSKSPFSRPSTVDLHD